MVCLGFRLEFCDYSPSTAGHGEFAARSSGCLSEFAARSGGCGSEFATGLHGGCFGLFRLLNLPPTKTLK